MFLTYLLLSFNNHIIGKLFNFTAVPTVKVGMMGGAVADLVNTVAVAEVKLPQVSAVHE